MALWEIQFPGFPVTLSHFGTNYLRIFVKKLALALLNHRDISSHPLKQCLYEARMDGKNFVCVWGGRVNLFL